MKIRRSTSRVLYFSSWVSNSHDPVTHLSSPPGIVVPMFMEADWRDCRHSGLIAHNKVVIDVYAQVMLEIT